MIDDVCYLSAACSDILTNGEKNFNVIVFFLIEICNLLSKFFHNLTCHVVSSSACRRV